MKAKTEVKTAPAGDVDGLGTDSDDDADDAPIAAMAAEPKRPTAKDEKRRGDEEAKRKKQVRNCQQCGQWGIRAVDHFKSCKMCPFHKDYVHPKHDDDARRRLFERLVELGEKALEGATRLVEKFQPMAIKDGNIEVGELEDAVATRLLRFVLTRQGNPARRPQPPPARSRRPRPPPPPPRRRRRPSGGVRGEVRQKARAKEA